MAQQNAEKSNSRKSARLAHVTSMVLTSALRHLCDGRSGVVGVMCKRPLNRRHQTACGLDHHHHPHLLPTL